MSMTETQSSARPSPDPPTPSSRLSVDPVLRLRRWLAAPVDAASLAVARIAFGLVVVWEAYRYVDNGWIARYWIEPAYNFTYPGFWWVQPLPGPGMYLVWAVIALCGALMALGAFHRVAAAVFTVLFTYQFLLEQSRYLNHFYLMILVGLLLVVVPANRVWSIDAARAGGWPSTVPRWALWLVQFQVAAMYVGGGIAKLDGDWLAGRPLSSWIAVHDSWPLVGPLLADPATGVVLAWAGMLLDLLIVPALLWRPTRIAALFAIGSFHLANARLFQIGVFPPMAMALTTVLLPPGWPRRAGAVLAGGLRGVLGLSDRRPPPRGRPGRRTGRGRRDPAPAPVMSVAALVVLGLFVASQVLVPLRHWAYGGEPSWTEQGHNFAWHMKLRAKGGDVDYVVVDADGGAVWQPDLEDHLEGWQIGKMSTRPQMIVAFAHELARQAREDRGFSDPQVRVDALVRLNGRPAAPMIDPDADLLAVDRVGEVLMPHPDEQVGAVATP